MILPNFIQALRRKAVWGPKRTALALLVSLASVAPTMAFATPHTASKPGVPSAHVKDYKLDRELTKRSTDRNPRNTTRVIVTGSRRAATSVS